MLAALVSNTALRSHAESDNHTAFTPSFATNDKTATPPPLCTFEADIPSQCECVAALRLSDAVGSVGAGAVIGAVVFIARSGLNAFFCDEHVTFEDEAQQRDGRRHRAARAALPLPRVPPPRPSARPRPRHASTSPTSRPRSGRSARRTTRTRGPPSISAPLSLKPPSRSTSASRSRARPTTWSRLPRPWRSSGRTPRSSARARTSERTDTRDTDTRNDARVTTAM